jgi:hypothetical protein
MVRSNIPVLHPQPVGTSRRSNTLESLNRSDTPESLAGSDALEPPNRSDTPLIAEEEQQSIRLLDPFPCVYKECTKTFPRENQWRQHDEMFHYRPAHWMCFLCNEIRYCGNNSVPHLQDSIVQHFREYHKVTRIDALHNEIDRNFIKANHQESFHCPLCDEIYRHGITGVEAADFRLDHLADHHKHKKVLQTSDDVAEI